MISLRRPQPHRFVLHSCAAVRPRPFVSPPRHPPSHASVWTTAPTPPLLEEPPGQASTPYDPFRWMENRNDPQVLRYLEEENAFSQRVLSAPELATRTRDFLQDLQSQQGLLAEASSSCLHVHAAYGPYLYYQRTGVGGRTIYLRRPNPLARQRTEGHAADRQGQQQHPLSLKPVEQGLLDLKDLAPGEEVLLDVNELDADYVDVHTLRLSTPDQRLVAYTLDTSGQEDFTLYVKDLWTGQLLVQHTLNQVGAVELVRVGPCEGEGTQQQRRGQEQRGEWRLFYTTGQGSGGRPTQIRRRVVRLPVETCDAEPEDQCLLQLQEEEQQGDDDGMLLDLNITKDRQWLLLQCLSKSSAGVSVVPCHSPDIWPVCVVPARPGVDCTLESQEGNFLLLSNEDAPNYRILQASQQLALDSARQQEQTGVATIQSIWRELVPENPDAVLHELDCFSSHLVLYQRHTRSMSSQLTLVPRLQPNQHQQVRLPASFGQVTPGANQDYQTDEFVFFFTSPLLPELPYRCRFSDQSTQPHLPLASQSHLPFPSDHSAEPQPLFCSPAVRFPPELQHIFSQLVCYTIHVPVSPGAEEQQPARQERGVPVTVLHRADMSTNGQNQLLLEVYGAYGTSLSLSFRPSYLPLLTRGWVVALAHVRGGGELGPAWHRAGAGINKQQGLRDTEAVLRALHDKGFSNPWRSAVTGASAAGAILGQLILPSRARQEIKHEAEEEEPAEAQTQRQPLLSALLLKNPFLDVLNSMLNQSLPYTSHERDEWGDPRDPVVYRVMEDYCPYQQALRALTSVKTLKQAETQIAGKQTQDALCSGMLWPSLLMTSSLFDARVMFWEASKFMAAHRHLHHLLHGSRSKLGTVIPQDVDGKWQRAKLPATQPDFQPPQGSQQMLQGSTQSPVLLLRTNLGTGGHLTDESNLWKQATEWAFLDWRTSQQKLV
eukprot:gb/GEZN01000841.1/.p1 GENE.gb/GEZN01000841.1/~~gb/GEZN01000841.1/.p1  ORF type:complete len:942 (-),score=150.78 gb/GEZN01000841.1/:678-3503(-)